MAEITSKDYNWELTLWLMAAVIALIFLEELILAALKAGVIPYV